MPISAIDEPLVLSVLRPLWTAKNVTARRMRQRVASVLDYATAAGIAAAQIRRVGKGTLNICSQRPERIAKVEHYAALPYAELPAFIAELRDVKGVPARALEFMISTETRTNEVRGATWDEFDLDNAVWTVPDSRMKTRKEHRVPLSRQTVELLRALPREGNLVFIGTKAGASIGKVAMLRVLQRLRPEVTPHGFRWSFRTWAEERTGYATVLAEQALAHTIGSAVERSYRRTDLFEQRARLMQQWADFCDTPVAANEVTPLRLIRS